LNGAEKKKVSWKGKELFNRYGVIFFMIFCFFSYPFSFSPLEISSIVVY